MHFMVMNGTAWQLSDDYFHPLSSIINLIPHYTPFFSCIPHLARTKKGKSLQEEDSSPDEQAESDGNCGVTVFKLEGVALGQRKAHLTVKRFSTGVSTETSGPEVGEVSLTAEKAPYHSMDWDKIGHRWASQVTFHFKPLGFPGF